MAWIEHAASLFADVSFQYNFMYAINEGKKKMSEISIGVGQRYDNYRATHPLGHNVSLTNSTGTTNFGDEVGDTEKHLVAAADCAAMVRLRMLR